MAWPADLKRQEFVHKLASIGAEFEHWRSESATGKRLRKHNSQIAAVTRKLEALAAAIGTRLDNLTDDEQFLAEWPRIQADILDVHRIWEFFRSKLALRYVEWFQEPLTVADEFAWECYRPARERAAADGAGRRRGREPPLVFFNGGWSPFAMARGVQYETEYVPGEVLRADALREVLKGLPIPVIGIPRYQVEHLPEAVVIGHEVGHTVEDDFGLTATLHGHVATAVTNATEAHRQAWATWAGEVFGDVYGVLATGPAFVAAMMDFLAKDVATVSQQAQWQGRWLVHPPDALRIEINLAALRAVKFKAEAAQLEATWRQRFPDHAMEDFSGEVEPVVDAILGGGYPELGGASLMEVLSFSATDHHEALKTADRVLKNLAPTERDIRRLVAAARLAFARKPNAYSTPGNDGLNAQDRIIARALQVQTDEVRGRPKGQGEPFTTPEPGEGEQLLDMIHSLREKESPEPPDGRN